MTQFIPMYDSIDFETNDILPFVPWAKMIVNTGHGFRAFETMEEYNEYLSERKSNEHNIK